MAIAWMLNIIADL